MAGPDTLPTEPNTGKGKPAVGARKKKAKKSRKQKCIDQARADSEKWNQCIEDSDSWWRSIANQLGAFDTPEEVCEEEALQACTPKKRGGKSRKKKKEDAEQLRKEKNQTEQAFLLGNLTALSEYMRNEVSDAALKQRFDASTPSRFKNLSIVTGVAGNLANVMTTSRKLLPLFSASPLELSSLVPSIKIYKVEKNGERHLFRFPNKITFEENLAGEPTRTAQFGPGLKNFDVQTTGKDPFTAPRTLMASMKLHFQTLDDLIKSSAGDGIGMRWTDLILPAEGGIQTTPADPCAQTNVEQSGAAEVKPSEPGTNFKIQVELGYSYPTQNVLSDELKEAIDRSSIKLELTIRQHSFSFSQNGTIDLDIQYMARFENVMDTYSADVFNLDEKGKNAVGDKLKELRELKASLAAAQSSISSPTGIDCRIKAAKAAGTDTSDLEEKKKETREQIDAAKQLIDQMKKNLRVSNHGRFVQYLIENGKMFTAIVDKEDYADGIFNENSSATSVADATTAASLLADSTAQQGKKVYDKKPTSKGDIKIYYFYLGDLIDFIAGALPSGEGEVPYNIVLGDMEYLDITKLTPEMRAVQDPSQEQVAEFIEALRSNINLSCVPVSLDLYSQWFQKKVTNGQTIWSVKDYLNSAISELVGGSIRPKQTDEVGTGFKKLLSERTKVRRTLVVGTNNYMARGSYTVGNSIAPASGESKIWIDQSPKQDSDISQFLILSVSKLPASSRVVDVVKNAEQGIYHLKIGQDSGIVKSIDFKKVDNAGVRDWNIMRAYNTGDTSLGAILEPYNATVKVFGSGFFQPGQYVYLNPTSMGFGNATERYSLARKLGLGGFYLITSVDTSLESGTLETTLECKFEYYGQTPDTAGADNDPVTDAILDAETPDIGDIGDIGDGGILV